MNYLIFKLDEKHYALELDQTFNFEPTQINKIVSKTKRKKSYAGEINYRNEIIDVYDIARRLSKEELKKFDGLIFIQTEERKFAIKFNGFYKIEDSPLGNKVLTIEKILKIT